MNLYSIINRGIALAEQERTDANAKKIAAACEKLRDNWKDALYADQARAWMGLGEQQTEALNGLAAMLCLAGFAKVFDTKQIDCPDIRVIRGAISAAQQCARREYQMDAATARALSAAATRAIDILNVCTHEAIQHASAGLADVEKMLEAA